MALVADDYSILLDSPLGRLGILLDGDAVSRLDYLSAGTGLRPPQAPTARRLARQLEAFFAGDSRTFSLPLRPSGTPYQQRVWQALQTIPYGETWTYGQLARYLGSGARAVGNACRHNPVPVIIPCHRVVSATGMGGYAGRTAPRAIWRKRWLLAHEAAVLKNATGAPISDCSHH